MDRYHKNIRPLPPSGRGIIKRRFDDMHQSCTLLMHSRKENHLRTYYSASTKRSFQNIKHVVYSMSTVSQFDLLLRFDLIKQNILKVLRFVLVTLAIFYHSDICFCWYKVVL